MVGDDYLPKYHRPSTHPLNQHPKFWNNPFNPRKFDKMMEEFELDEEIYYLRDANTDEILGIATKSQVLASFSKGEDDPGIIMVKNREVYVD